MVSNQQLKARLIAGLVALTLGLTAGCSHVRSSEAEGDAQAAPPVAQAEPAAEATAAEDLTATEAATANGCGTASEAAPAGSDPRAHPIKPDAPQELHRQARRHALGHLDVVPARSRGSGPRSGIVNPQVENPHLIYPG